MVDIPLGNWKRRTAHTRKKFAFHPKCQMLMRFLQLATTAKATKNTPAALIFHRLLLPKLELYSMSFLTLLSITVCAAGKSLFFPLVMSQFAIFLLPPLFVGSALAWFFCLLSSLASFSSFTDRHFN
ncbi:hypothetical protein niasHT_015102 [Heterodera trifolii]|uniref:Uncharacterized protein n=1 Tax=Heterodera trifolii TaxID=157864 RepID=A0ABD2L9U2_9BILA